MPCGYRRGSISEGLHPTLMVAALAAAKVGNARPWSSYERYETSPPTSHNRVLEFVVCSATLQKRAGQENARRGGDLNLSAQPCPTLRRDAFRQSAAGGRG